MMNGGAFMLFVLVTWLIGTYVIEVIFGTCVGEHNAELGYDSCCMEVTRLSNRQYFTQLLPLLLCIAGLLVLLGALLRG